MDEELRVRLVADMNKITQQINTLKKDLELKVNTNEIARQAKETGNLYKVALIGAIGDFNKKAKPSFIDTDILKSMPEAIKETIAEGGKLKDVLEVIKVDIEEAFDKKGLKENLKIFGEQAKETFSNIKKWLNRIGIAALILGIKKLIDLIKNVDMSGFAEKFRQPLQQIRDNFNQLKANATAMGLELLIALKPAIDWLISVLNDLVQGIRAFLKSIGIVSFKGIINGAAAASTAVAKLRRELMGFDELNVLPGIETSGGGSSSGYEMPNPESIEADPPAWLVWIKDNLPTILEVIGGVIAYLKIVSPLLDVLGVSVTKIQGLKITIALIGLGKVIEGVTELVNGTTTVLEGNMDIVGGLALAIGGVAAAITGSWIPALVGLGTYLGTELVSWLGSAERAEDRVKAATERHNESVKQMTESYKNYKTAQDSLLQVSNLLEAQEKKLGISGEQLYNNLKSGKISVEDLTDEELQLLDLYWEKEDAMKTVEDRLKQYEKSITNSWTTELEEQKMIGKTTGSWQGYFDTLNNGYKQGYVSASGYAKEVETTLGSLNSKGRQEFAKFAEIPEDVWKKINSFTKEQITQFKSYVKKQSNEINEEVKKDMSIDLTQSGKKAGDSFVQGMKNSLNNTQVKVKIDGSTVSTGTINIQKLAKGGITTGSTLANIGEAGREAVLPLENNTEWMDVLADRIASRAQQKVVLNVDGRQLGMATISSINGITAETGSLPLRIM